eukprot:1460520-Ditylum_brightwellii.AAC.1
MGLVPRNINIEKLCGGGWLTPIVPAQTAAYLEQTSCTSGGKDKLSEPCAIWKQKGAYINGCTLLEIITMDSLQLYCLNGAIVNNDATVCYNCMIPEVMAVHL